MISTEETGPAISTSTEPPASEESSSVPSAVMVLPVTVSPPEGVRVTLTGLPSAS